MSRRKSLTPSVSPALSPETANAQFIRHAQALLQLPSSWPPTDEVATHQAAMIEALRHGAQANAVLQEVEQYEGERHRPGRHFFQCCWVGRCMAHLSPDLWAATKASAWGWPLHQYVGFAIEQKEDAWFQAWLDSGLLWKGRLPARSNIAVALMQRSAEPGVKELWLQFVAHPKGRAQAQRPSRSEQSILYTWATLWPVAWRQRPRVECDWWLAQCEQLGLTVNHRNVDGHSIFSHAAVDHAYLISKGADAVSLSIGCETSAWRGRLDEVQLFVNAGAKVAACDPKSGNSLLHVCLMTDVGQWSRETEAEKNDDLRRHIELALWLLEQGLDPTQNNKAGHDVWSAAMTRTNHPEINARMVTLVQQQWEARQLAQSISRVVEEPSCASPRPRL